jgi:hypothetical protein
MNANPLRRLARTLDRMSPLQRDASAGLMSGDDRWNDDERLAERYGTTPGAVRIERLQARRFLQETLETGADSPR